MAKNNVWWIIGIIIVGLLIWNVSKEKPMTRQALFAAADLSTAYMERSFSANTIKSGQTFTVGHTYKNIPNPTTDLWMALWTDNVVTGTCTPSVYNSGQDGPAGTWPKLKTYTANGVDGSTCVFSGTYALVSNVNKTGVMQGPTTVNICANQVDCTTGSEKGCVDSATRWDCALGGDGICYDKITHACQTSWACSSGICTALCGGEAGSLRILAGDAITAWILSPTTPNFNLALTAINRWAMNC